MSGLRRWPDLTDEQRVQALDSIRFAFDLPTDDEAIEAIDHYELVFWIDDEGNVT